MTEATFEPVAPAAYDGLALALSAADLPTEDLHEPGRIFHRMSDEAGPIGFIGLEGAGADRLLRSLVVLPSRRRQGHGRLLVAHLESFARRAGVERLHLLTTSVTELFHAEGYRTADRAAAPAAIAGTRQFSALCPGSAAYLVKDLA